MKGIILAGGSGTRLYPLTKVTSKQLLPVYDKPMIYYPLSTLMLAGIRDILIISTPQDLPNFQRLLGDGNQFGIQLSYKVQPSPDGLAQAFVLGEEFIGDEDVCLILGDNIFHGNHFSEMLEKAKVLSLEEKPENPKSNYAVVGLYFYDNRVVEYAKNLKPSARGEYEITDLNKVYLEKGEIDCVVFGRGFAWLDTGTISSLAQASNFVKTIEEVQGIKISVPEEIAFYNHWIDTQQLLESADSYGKSPYGEHLRTVASGNFVTSYNK